MIDHAIRVTVPSTDARYVWPARHEAGIHDASLPPMGLRLRLKASVDIAGYPRADRVILQALKTYGMIIADNGSAWYLSGTPSPAWDNSILHELDGIVGSDFRRRRAVPHGLAELGGREPREVREGVRSAVRGAVRAP